MSPEAAIRPRRAGRITIKTKVNKHRRDCQRAAYDQRQYDGNEWGGDQDLIQ